MKFRTLIGIAFLPVLSGYGIAIAEEGSAAQSCVAPRAEAEATYFKAIENIGSGEVDSALRILEDLIADYPDFSLAQLTYADVLSSRTGELDYPGGDYRSVERVEELLLEANRRKLHQNVESPLGEHLWPANILKLSNSQKHVVIVDVSKSRVYLYENTNGSLVPIDDYYVSIGKAGVVKTREGDARTPIGVYFLTTKISSDYLSDLYGSGALPINYPNEWDQKQGRSGYGIWLHGVPSNTYSRAPYASQGCMALSNEHISMLLDTLDVGNTPVIITDKLETISVSQRDQLHNKLMSYIYIWNKDRLSGDASRFASHYADQNKNASTLVSLLVDPEYPAELVNGTNNHRIENISIFQYPLEKDMVVVTFEQSGINTDGSRRIRQYWQAQDDGEWKIVQENLARFTPVHFRGIPSAAMSQADLIN